MLSSISFLPGLPKAVQPRVTCRQERLPEQVGRLNQSREKVHNLHLPEKVYQMGSGFSQVHLYQCSLVRLPASGGVGVAPQTSRSSCLPLLPFLCITLCGPPLRRKKKT